jgi:hypothetical protein
MILRNTLSSVVLAIASLCGLTGCKEKAADEAANTPKSDPSKIVDVQDPDAEQIRVFRKSTREAYDQRRFDELEKVAAEIRSAKSTFPTGSWKIVQFYNAFDVGKTEPASAWEDHERIHREWMAAKPDSITARVAYADFLTSYAWQARGSGYADTVTEDGWRLFRERLSAARTILREASKSPEKDPYWGLATLTVALGQEWSKEEYDALMEELKTFEPKFWGYDTARAKSLLPRWHGQPGDWEAYADQASSRPDGLGMETYARIVFFLVPYHKNIFQDSKASWPKTREGLAQMRKRLSDSPYAISVTALLATMAQDRGLAKEMFDRLDGACLANVWPKREFFLQCQKWAHTGRW